MITHDRDGAETNPPRFESPRHHHPGPEPDPDTAGGTKACSTGAARTGAISLDHCGTRLPNRFSENCLRFSRERNEARIRLRTGRRLRRRFCLGTFQRFHPVRGGQHLIISRRGLPSPGDAQEGQALPWQGELQMGYAVLNRNPGWRGEELQLSGALQLIVLLGGRRLR